MPSRIRTESMIDRLGKKPISEGFDLWDKDYPLGALRLLQCKLDAQTAGTPPFEVAAALDAVGEIMVAVEETDEATDHFKQAVDKYSMIGKKVLADLMECKAVQVAEGDKAALEKVDKTLDAHKDGAAGAVGRVYFYKAVLLQATDDQAGSLEAAEQAVKLGSDRIHLAHALKGDLLKEKKDTAGAEEAYRAAIAARDIYVPAYHSLLDVLKEKGAIDDAIAIIDKVQAIHPQAANAKEKAFMISEKGDDAGALALLEDALKNPVHDETESVGGGASEATIHKAKAAILADQGKFDDALAALEASLKVLPDDAEAESMLKGIKEAAGGK